MGNTTKDAKHIAHNVALRERRQSGGNVKFPENTKAVWSAVPKSWLLGFGALPHRTRCPGVRSFSSFRRFSGNLAIHCQEETKATTCAHSMPRR
jgi:hypothetical protein